MHSCIKFSYNLNSTKTHTNYPPPPPPPKVVRPRQIRQPILHVRNTPRHNLSTQMLWQRLMQATLHRKRLVQKLLIKPLFGLMHHDHSHPLVVKLGAAGTAHHLEDVGDGEVNIGAAGGVVVFGAFYDDEVGRGVHAPGEGGGCY